ncbi:DNA/RNA nuclease SfsA [Thermotoga sp. KOL6]|uniref:DNA/RNA nuclease SfsA n=1 Tax=Thermotoga sp. KOL6 TaxID=126741 RepID=UPI000C75D764|nr:DNA/RNA nuclease SfsA [Thermotoga sp. KOL6]PLV59280.1 sugar fermentation stimulation protein [Thermotoga sp. KOL6]
MRLKIPFDSVGTFLKRESRFTGVVLVDDVETRVHIHNTGRLPILSEGKRVFLKRKKAQTRRTGWDLLAVEHEGELVFVHSGYHSITAEGIIEELFPNFEITREKKLGNSRLDFLVDERICIEVKGCTFRNENVAMFPDAPTRRGTKHVRELMRCVEKGFKAILLILVFLESDCFSPNEEMDPDFAETFWMARKKGVNVLIFRLKYDGEYLYSIGQLPICGEV